MFEVIKRYLESEKLSASVLIDGTWGSGKTYYFKNNFENIYKKKVIYTSINGINNLNDIYKQIFLSRFNLDKITKNPQFQLLLKTVEAGIKLLPFIDKFSPPEINFDAFVDLLKNHVLIIDDIERMGDNISINELFGFITIKFTEAKNIKVILICDESKLIKRLNANEKYLEIKEKSIWQTVPFKSQIDEAFDGLVKEYNNGTFTEFILENKNEILLLLNEYKIGNLRTVNYFLFIFFEIFKNCKNLINIENKSALLDFTLIYCNEFKEGNIESEKNIDHSLGIVQRGRTFLYSGNETLDITHKNSQKEDNFNQRYFRKAKSNYTYLTSVISLIYSGTFDNILFEEEISRLKIREIDVIFGELENPLKLEQEDFDDKWVKVIKHIDSPDCKLHDLLNISAIYENAILKKLSFSIQKDDLYILLNNKSYQINDFYDVYKSNKRSYYLKIQNDDFKNASKKFIDLEERVRNRSTEIHKLQLYNELSGILNKLDSKNELSSYEFELILYNSDNTQWLKLISFANKNSVIANQIVEYIERIHPFWDKKDASIKNKIMELTDKCLQNSTVGSIVWANYDLLKEKMNKESLFD